MQKFVQKDYVNSIRRFEVLRTFNQKISEEEKLEMNSNFSVQEVEQTIDKLRPNTSPGPCGLTAELYQYHKFEMARWLCRRFQNAFRGKKLPNSFKTAYIKLLPKADETPNADYFRPISSINTDQKNLAHVLAHLSKKVLSQIINPQQYAYLPGRNMHKPLPAIQLEFVQPGTSLVSLDFKKAFDKVDSVYLFQLLRKMNFPDEIVNLVESMYRHPKVCLVINGYLTDAIKLQRGVKQGCPLSALVFLIALELRWCSS